MDTSLMNLVATPKFKAKRNFYRAPQKKLEAKVEAVVVSPPPPTSYIVSTDPATNVVAVRPTNPISIPEGKPVHRGVRKPR